MNLSEIKQIISKSESERLEYKKSTGQRTEAAKTVCGMLNGTGGYVLFGISDKREIVGQEIGQRTLEELANELARIEPPFLPDIETVECKPGRFVILIRVPGGSGLYTFDGRPYLRQGPTTRLMPRPRFERLLLEQMHASHRWENQLAEGIGLKDLDRTEIVRTVDEAIRRGRMEDPGTRNATGLLAGLGLLSEKKQPLNAAVALFCKSDKLLPNYPQCIVRMARFKGTDKSEFLDNRQENGNAFEIFMRSQRFLRDHLPIAGRIEPGLFERVDDPLYPPAALREAIANAICHRDYGIGGGSVGIAIFDDRLEVTSTGILPFDITAADLSRTHRSRPWNPLISQVFYRRGIIETWGRGTNKIIELSKAAGLPAPEFECRTGDVLVRFILISGAKPPKARKAPAPAESADKSLSAGSAAHDTAHDAAHGAAQVTAQVIKLLQCCKKPSSRSEMQREIGLMHRESFRMMYLKPALDMGFIERTIPWKPFTKFQKYRITELGKSVLEREKPLFPDLIAQMSEQHTAQHTAQDTAQDTAQVTGQVIQLLRCCKEPTSRLELQGKLGLAHRETFRKLYLKPCLDMGFIEKTEPGKPFTKFQKYRITELGQGVLEGEKSRTSDLTAQAIAQATAQDTSQDTAQDAAQVTALDHKKHHKPDSE
ncbi:MAG: putative DNA binding domain-containing protein [Candidatus Sumerlaeota bacterium]|nr:putative DNA binding domain-containing protein [Candidatus Sumerlaeota bacterium]